MTPPTAGQLGLVLCYHCKQACPQGSSDCLRCGARLHHRKPASLSRTLALVIAALVLYVPANLLPIFRTSGLTGESATTILGSVVNLWNSGAWDIALIIFIASVGVPVTKFLVLGLLLVTVHRGHERSRKERTQLYRLLELVGYWSMLDVFVAGLLAALVQFGMLGQVEPEPGILFFGLVVILTMLATLSFDPRLIWDAGRHND